MFNDMKSIAERMCSDFIIDIVLCGEATGSKKQEDQQTFAAGMRCTPLGGDYYHKESIRI
jgi:hypothetical protein